jgi:hypothetical protein
LALSVRGLCVGLIGTNGLFVLRTKAELKARSCSLKTE